MRIEIICTGDEVLTGAIVNTNFSHISQRLGDVGLAVQWGPRSGTIGTPCCRRSGLRGSVSMW